MFVCVAVVFYSQWSGGTPSLGCIGGECASCLRLSMREGKLQALIEMVEESQEVRERLFGVFAPVQLCICRKTFRTNVHICDKCNKTRKSEYYN